MNSINWRQLLNVNGIKEEVVVQYEAESSPKNHYSHFINKTGTQTFESYNFLAAGTDAEAIIDNFVKYYPEFAFVYPEVGIEIRIHALQALGLEEHAISKELLACYLSRNVLGEVLNVEPELKHEYEKLLSEKQAEFLKLLSDESQQLLIFLLKALIIQLRRAGRCNEALELLALSHTIVKLRPESEIQSFFGNTQPRNMADILLLYSSIYSELGNFSFALDTLIKAEHWCEKDATLRTDSNSLELSEYDLLFHPFDIRSELYSAIAGVYEKLGDLNSAELYAKRAQEFGKIIDPNTELFFKLLGLVGTYREIGNNEKALEYSLQALDITLNLWGSKVTSAFVVNALEVVAEVYSDLKLHRKSLQYYNKLLDINRSNNRRNSIIDNFVNIALIHSTLGEYQKSIGFFEEALLACSIKYSSVPIDYIDADFYSLAIDHDVIGRNIWEHEGIEYEIILPRQALTVLLQLTEETKCNHLDKTIKYLELAVKLVETLRFGVLGEEPQITYQSFITKVYDTIIEVQLELYEREKDQCLLSTLFRYIDSAKSRILVSQLADLSLPIPTAVNPQLIDEEIRLLNEIAKLESKVVNGYQHDFNRIGEQITLKQQAIRKLWREIEKEGVVGEEYVSLRRAKPLFLEEVRALITDKNRNAVVSYYVTHKHLITLILYSDKEHIDCFVSNISRDKLRDLVNIDENYLIPPDLSIPYWQLDLAPLVVEPIVNTLTNYELICFVPHDVIHTLPLHALCFNQEGNRSLITQFNIVYAPALSILKFCKSKHEFNKGNNLVLGNPKRSDEPSIPNTQQEAQAIAKMLGCDSFVGEDATKRIVVEKSKNSQFIHFACHGKFNRIDVQSSALLLTDEDLTVQDIFNLNLKAELVVLSACQTGIVENKHGDELFGLVRAFLFAGASSILVSMWNAYDKSSNDLMCAFYENLINLGMTKAEALASAQRKLVVDGHSPALWAPFILIGNWQ